MKVAPPNLLVWFGVLGGAVAWLVQFAINLFFTFAQCNQPAARFSLPVHGLEIGLSAGALVIAGSAEAVALRMYLRTHLIDDASVHERRGDGVHPPLGRVQFLAQLGLLVNFLAIAIIIMTGVGAPLLPVCQQS